MLLQAKYSRSCSAPNKSLQRSGTHKLLGRGAAERREHPSAARPRAKRPASGR